MKMSNLSLNADEYLACSRKVLGVMDAVVPCVSEVVDGYCEEGLQKETVREAAIAGAQVYALRDVMTLMLCGVGLEEALEAWTLDKGPLGMRGECTNAVIDAIETAGAGVLKED